MRSPSDAEITAAARRVLALGSAADLDKLIASASTPRKTWTYEVLVPCRCKPDAWCPNAGDPITTTTPAHWRANTLAQNAARDWRRKLNTHVRVRVWAGDLNRDGGWRAPDALIASENLPRRHGIVAGLGGSFCSRCENDRREEFGGCDELTCCCRCRAEGLEYRDEPRTEN
jgi:hypothetical protein